MTVLGIRGVLLDLGGVVYSGDRALPGSLEAVERIKNAGLGLRYITNTTRTSYGGLMEKLAKIGVVAARGELLTPAQVARTYLMDNRLSPHLLVHSNLEEDFADVPASSHEAVVIGDAADRFSFAALNEAYRKIEKGALFLALADNRNFLDADGELSLDAGAFVRALEYASGRTAMVLGKPSAAFFQLACQGLGCEPHETVMIGDDAEADVGGAIAAGLRGVLVRTGKYRSGQEARLAKPPDLVAEDLATAVDWLLGS